jgi:hypothetical protein
MTSCGCWLCSQPFGRSCYLWSLVLEFSSFPSVCQGLILRVPPHFILNTRDYWSGNLNKKSVKYLQVINFSQLTLAEKPEITSLGRAASELVISQSSSSRIQTYVRKLNPALYAKRKWLSGCAERNALSGLLIFFSYGSTAPWGPRPPHFSRLHDHTQTHHTR